MTDVDLRRRVFDTLASLLPEVLQRDIAAPSDATRLADLDVGSADMLALVLRLEDELEIQVDVEEFDEADGETLGALSDFIARHSVSFA
jgi:acyl carrier protein